MTALLVAMLIGAPSYPANMAVGEGYVPCDRQCRTERRWRRTVRPHRAHLESIAACESGGRWHISTGNGYYGGLQFSLSSWGAVGGYGYPHHATKLEQMYRAVLLSRQGGWGHWPVCGCIHLHGLELHADDALRLNVMALGECAEALDAANTFHGYEVAAGFLHTTMLDAVAVFGLSIADIVRYTDLGPDVVLDIIGQGFQPFTPGGSL